MTSTIVLRKFEDTDFPIPPLRHGEKRSLVITPGGAAWVVTWQTTEGDRPPISGFKDDTPMPIGDTTACELVLYDANFINQRTTMSPAELKMTLLGLGMTQSDMARRLQRSVRGIQAITLGTRPVAEGISEIVRTWVHDTDDIVRSLIAAIVDDPCPVLTIYRTDDEMWGDLPDLQPWPHTWWTMCAWRAKQEIPDLNITYLKSGPVHD